MERNTEMKEQIKKLEEELIHLVRMTGDKFLDETDYNHFVCRGYHQLTDKKKIESLEIAIIDKTVEYFHGEGPYSS